ncbi:MAG: S-methyl-5'-thioadenosine phosphorylase [Acidimicrobiia bacterium]|nr:S-methyl-5'-thioadenosine phosphorylase [Acidimicrobiia bacterium]
MIGVIGGTGFYEFLENAREVTVDTPFGNASAPLTVGSVDGIEVAFLPRHGRDHQFPPHLVPYRANLWALKEAGVDRIISPTAAGSLARNYEPGHLVVSDQLVDRTWGRPSTFYEGPKTVHVSFADPYCPELRPPAIDSIRAVGATVHERGTMVVIPGPRFSTRAESRWYAGQGWEVIGMTQAPEAALARELEMCFVNIAVITDYDVGVEGDIPPVSHAAVIERFEATLGTLKEAVKTLVPLAARTPRACPCATALATAGG